LTILCIEIIFAFIIGTLRVPVNLLVSIVNIDILDLQEQYMII